MSTAGENSDDEQQNASTKLDMSLWRELFGYALRYKRKVSLLAIFAIATGASEVCFPLVSRALIDEVTQTMESGVASAVSIHLLMPYIWAYAGLILWLVISVFFFIRYAGFLKAHMAADIRTAGFEKLQRLEFAFFDKRASGWLMARMTSDCERLANIMAWGVLDVLWATTFLVGIAAAMMVLSWKLGLIILLAAPLLAGISRFFQRRMLKASRAIRKVNSTITADFNESIMGERTTKTFVREGANLLEFQKKTDDMFDASVLNAVLASAYLPSILTIGSLTTAAALIVGGVQVTGFVISLGTLVAFLNYTRMLFEPLQQLAHIFSEMQMAQASGERIVEMIATEPAIADSEEVLARIAAQAKDPMDGVAEDGFPDEMGAIEFCDVDFSYIPEEKVLRGVNLKVEPGQTIALVGSTGGGKSTMISLLCRFYEPTSGSIRMGGCDLRERSLGWLQSHLGIVLQDPHLFSGSVLENIRYGRLEATDEEVLNAARLVGADKFVAKLDDQFDFNVGEGGGLLSSGERQLISFARAILADPKILIMDEATSSIDTETERHIQEGLERVLKDRTSFVIAHRLSTIENADRIVVVEKGEIAEEGTHHELMLAGGRYHELHARQGIEELGVHAGDWSEETPL
jgi:ATP-binding cassette subfamily B protein